MGDVHSRLASANEGEQRHNFWFREIRATDRNLAEPFHGCLVVLDSFALPGGPAGRTTPAIIDPADYALGWKATSSVQPRSSAGRLWKSDCIGNRPIVHGG